MSALYMSIMRCTVGGHRTVPEGHVLHLQHQHGAHDLRHGSPLPQAWLITRLVCSCARSFFAMEVSYRDPKPVFTP
jgi:multisubunit Na+/H+ antiporter MnhC subunit